MHGPDAAYFERIARWSASERVRAEVDALIAALRLEPSARVLEVGSGTGAVLRRLGEHGVRPLGVERAPAALPFLRGRAAAAADAAALPFPGEVFDAVVLAHSIAHLAAPAESLREVHRVLRPQGLVGVLTPNLSYLELLRAVPGNAVRYAPDPTVERHYRARQLTRLLRRAGFTVVATRHVGPGPLRLPLAPLRERVLAIGRKPR